MSNYALFPFGSVPVGSKIIIYGAGIAGKNFYTQVSKNKYCDVLFLIDKNSKNKNPYMVKVLSPEILFEYKDYDYIVISPMNDLVKEEILQDLQKIYKIAVSKIIVPSDNVINWEYSYQKLEDEISLTNKFPKYLNKISAKSLVSSRRIDVAIRYLLFKDFANGYENAANLSLFRRYTMLRTGGVEENLFHSTTIKKSINDYIDEGRALCESIKINGFKSDGFIPVNEKNETLDGLHRIAAAIVMDEDVYIHKYEGLTWSHVRFSFFDQEGFGFEDKVRILRSFCEIYAGNLGMVILFSPVKDMWTYLEKQIEKSFNIVGKLDYNFENNYIAFENIVREIYSDSAGKNEMIKRKLNILKYETLEIRVLLLNDEEHEKVCGDVFYETLRMLKLNLRERFWNDTKEVPIVMHTPDSKEEFIHLRNVLLSVNNIKCMERKVCQIYRGKFWTMLAELEKWCKENAIKRSDVVIVSSGTMEVFGLRECEDIDFIITPEHRKRFKGDCGFKISSNLELAHIDYARNPDMSIIADEIVITDDNLHFYFGGWKFVNLDLVLNKKKFSRRPKDIEDIRLIELYYKWDAVFDKKEALRTRIHDEMIRRKY